MKTIDTIAIILLIIGGLNWGLVGFFNFDLIAAIFGPESILSRIIYSLVGISAIWHAVQFNSIHRRWLQTHPHPQV